jgi:hypothetical protein
LTILIIIKNVTYTDRVYSRNVHTAVFVLWSAWCAVRTWNLTLVILFICVYIAPLMWRIMKSAVRLLQASYQIHTHSTQIHHGTKMNTLLCYCSHAVTPRPEDVGAVESKAPPIPTSVSVGIYRMEPSALCCHGDKMRCQRLLDSSNRHLGWVRSWSQSHWHHSDEATPHQLPRIKTGMRSTALTGFVTGGGAATPSPHLPHLLLLGVQRPLYVLLLL